MVFGVIWEAEIDFVYLFENSDKKKFSTYINRYCYGHSQPRLQGGIDILDRQYHLRCVIAHARLHTHTHTP